jgi:hypothetical protein
VLRTAEFADVAVMVVNPAIVTAAAAATVVVVVCVAMAVATIATAI